MDSDFPLENIYGRFRKATERNLAATALVIDGTPYTYGELDERIRRCATALSDGGCRAGDVVGLALGNSLDFVVTAFATFALDGILVPLNPRFKEEELRHYLQLSKPKAIIHPPALGEVVSSVDAVIPLRATSVDALGLPEPRAVSEATPAGVRSGIYMFSSGSTGKSKRITRTQQQWLLEYDALAKTVGLAASDCILCVIPLFHAHGFGNAMMAALLSGGTLVLLTPEFNARSTAQALEAFGVTVFPAVPFMFKILAETRYTASPKLERLRLSISAGAALPEAVSRRFSEVFGKPISQLYGSTETGAISINYEPSTDKPTSVGLPLYGTKIEIRDETGQRLGTHQTGEVWVSSPAATDRYDGLAELTKECFCEGFFFAGDLGQVDDDGYLTITGRKKLLVNVAGFKVDPLEVEEVLRGHARVSDVVVVGVEHAGAGEKIKAVVVCSEPGSCSEQELIDYAASRLAAYKVPKAVEFRAEIPRSPLGKVLRKYL